MDEECRQRVLDEEHLKLLSLFYKVSAAMAVLYGSFGLIYMFIGFAALLSEASGANPGDTAGLAVFFIFGLLFLAFGWGTAVLRWIAGVKLKQRKGLLFCQIVAGFTCLETPYGTAVGVMTFIVLSRPSVRAMFEQNAAATPAQVSA